MIQTADAGLERTTLSRVTWRLIPLMFLLYVFCIMDRVNIGIAVLTMKVDLKFSDAVYGLGAGMFFVGYFFFEVPSNILLERIGARIWIARITFTWGIIASSLMFVRSPASFYLVRFLLGAAEAGFFPGMVLYMTYWFPNSIRGRSAVRFMIANAFANIIGGPLGAQFLKLEGVGGLYGWQWLFLLEGIPSFLMGFAVLAWMTDKPEHAGWLRTEERDWLIRKLDAERTHRLRYHHMSLARAFAYPRVLHLSSVFFLNILAGSGLGFFSNLVLKQRTGLDNQGVLWLSAVPPIVGAVFMLISASHSDRTGERRLHVAVGLFLAALGMAVVAGTRSGTTTVLGLVTVSIGTAIANGPFWALTSGFLSGAAAAGGIAFINSVGNSGSFFGPVVMGRLKDATGGYVAGLVVMAAIFALAALVAFRLPPDPAQEHPPEAEREPARGE